MEAVRLWLNKLNNLTRLMPPMKLNISSVSQANRAVGCSHSEMKMNTHIANIPLFPKLFNRI
jgi:hypothetical protein